MEKKLHITLAGQRDLSYVSTAFPYLDCSVTKACSICSKKVEKIITGIFLLHFQLTGYLLGGGLERGREVQAKTINQLCSIYSLFPFSTILLLFRFVQKNTADLKKEVSRDPIFRNSRPAKMGSYNVILAIACRAHAQKGRGFLCFSKQYTKGGPPKQITAVYIYSPLLLEVTNHRHLGQRAFKHFLAIKDVTKNSANEEEGTNCTVHPGQKKLSL